MRRRDPHLPRSVYAKGAAYYHVRADGTLRLSADADLPGNHRHLSNLMGLHPFNLITAEGGPDDARAEILASVAAFQKATPKPAF